MHEHQAPLTRGIFISFARCLYGLYANKTSMVHHKNPCQMKLCIFRSYYSIDHSVFHIFSVYFLSNSICIQFQNRHWVQIHILFIDRIIAEEATVPVTSIPSTIRHYTTERPIGLLSVCQFIKNSEKFNEFDHTPIFIKPPTSLPIFKCIPSTFGRIGLRRRFANRIMEEWERKHCDICGDVCVNNSEFWEWIITSVWVYVCVYNLNGS